MAGSGPAPNDDRGYILVTIVAITLALALSLLCSRFYVRLKITKNPGWDDFFIVLAVVSGTRVPLRYMLANDYTR